MSLVTFHNRYRSLFNASIVQQALQAAVLKLDPRYQIKNPVMFVVWASSMVTTILLFHALAGTGEAPVWFILSITVWLWFTVLFANFAEAMAESRGKAQADSLRSARRELTARSSARSIVGANPMPCGTDSSSKAIRSAWLPRIN